MQSYIVLAGSLKAEVWQKRGQKREELLGHHRQQISAPIIVPTAAGRVKRTQTLLLTFYRRVRDRKHLAALEFDARNEPRTDRVEEETRKRFWQVSAAKKSWLPRELGN